MQFITYRQSIFLVSMILPVTGHFLLLQPLFDVSGVDGWLAILLTMPAGLLYVTVLWRLHVLHPDKTLPLMLEEGFGKIAGKILTPFLLIYFLYILMITFYALSDFINAVFLPETERWVIGLTFYLVVLYGINRGIESITRMAETLFFPILIVGLAVGFATHTDKDYGNLLPVVENGVLPVAAGMMITAALFGELVLLTMLSMRKGEKTSKPLIFTNIIVVFLITWMFVATTISSLAIFGPEQSANIEYPAQRIIRIVAFGVVERFDIYGVATIVFGCTVRMAAFQIVLYKGVSQWLNVKSPKIIHVVITAAVAGWALLGIDNHRYFSEVILRDVYPLTVAVSGGLPVLAWLTLEVKKKVKG